MKTLTRTHITVNVSDINRAIDFYTNTLALGQRYGDHYAEIKTPNRELGLHPVSGPVNPAANLSIGFGVTDFDGAVAELAEKGVALEVKQEPMIRLAHFTDPDGNALYLAEMVMQ